MLKNIFFSLLSSDNHDLIKFFISNSSLRRVSCAEFFRSFQWRCLQSNYLRKAFLNLLSSHKTRCLLNLEDTLCSYIVLAKNVVLQKINQKAILKSRQFVFRDICCICLCLNTIGFSSLFSFSLNFHFKLFRQFIKQQAPSQGSMRFLSENFIVVITSSRTYSG